MLYSVFGVAIEKARGAEDDINTVAAGTLTGMLFKSGSRCLFCYTCHYCTVYPQVLSTVIEYLQVCFDEMKVTRL